MAADVLLVLKIAVSFIIAWLTLVITRKFNDFLKKYNIDSYAKITIIGGTYLLAIGLIAVIITGTWPLGQLELPISQLWDFSVKGMIVLLELLAVLVGMRIAIGMYVSVIENQRAFLNQKMNFRKLQIDLVKETGKVLLYVLAGLLVLNILNLQGITNTILTSAGIAGIIIAFSTQNVLQSIFAGLLISADKSFEVGDSVKIDDMEGKIERIRLRTTVLRTGDGVQVTLPNSLVMNSVITNLSKHPTRRISLRLDVEKQKHEKTLKILKEKLMKLEFLDKQPQSEIFVDGFSTDFTSKTALCTVKIWLWTPVDGFPDKVRSTIGLVDGLLKKNKIKYYRLVAE